MPADRHDDDRHGCRHLPIARLPRRPELPLADAVAVIGGLVTSTFSPADHSGVFTFVDDLIVLARRPFHRRERRPPAATIMRP